MDSDGGSSSGDVSSTAANEQVPRADPELPPQPNVPPPTTTGTTGPTENEAAFLRQFARAYGGRLVLSRMPLGGANTGVSAIFFESTRDGGDGEDHPRRSDTDAAADAGADADDDDDEDEDEDDDAYGGFGFSFGAISASGVAIACLPETTVGEGEARDEGGECAVCLEEYEAGDALRTMPCAHGFHERCIVEWLLASRLCPLCRFALPSEEDTDSDVEAEVGRDDQEGDEADDDDGSDGRRRPIGHF